MNVATYPQPSTVPEGYVRAARRARRSRDPLRRLGTRLWPVSRESFPKQLWPLVSDHSMLQETALRAVGEAFAPPLVVCNQEHRFLIAEQLRAVGIEGAQIVLEPVGATRHRRSPSRR